MNAKHVLIIDEYGFSRICSAILNSAGYEVTNCAVSDLRGPCDIQDFGLIVTSHPYGTPVFNVIGKSHIPILILSDNIDENLIQILNTFDSSYCMIKPLDYEKFKSLVKEVLSSEFSLQEGYNIV